jgi:pimeloyl-ACP methyl ester carboxylesterase
MSNYSLSIIVVLVSIATSTIHGTAQENATGISTDQSVMGHPFTDDDRCNLQDDGSWLLKETDKGFFVPWEVPELEPDHLYEFIVEADNTKGTKEAGFFPIKIGHPSLQFDPISLQEGVAVFRAKTSTLNVGGEKRTIIYIKFEPPITVLKHLEAVALDLIEDVSMRSELVSKHLDRQWSQQAWVVRPSEITDSTPVIFNIAAFHADWEAAYKYNTYQAKKMAVLIANDLDAILVYPNVCVDGGHHGFVDSETNGPVGTMFVEEFMPWIDEHLGLKGNHVRHYITGHSSGGWSTAWLFLNWPDRFEGALATSPDPVDFRDFHGINLYEDTNAFVTNDGMAPVFENKAYSPRDQTPDPCITFDELTAETTDDFPNAQMSAYEAAFSQLDDEGQPRKLFDRQTGVIDKEVVEHWSKSDIGRLVRSKDKKQLKAMSRLFFYCGTKDEYGLHRPLRLLEDSIDNPSGFTWLENTRHSLPAEILKDFYYEVSSNTATALQEN